jgi:catalase
MDESPNQVVDAMVRDFPGWEPGTRPAHAKGTGAKGFFKPTVVAGSEYCKAEPFAGPAVPVTVRFSNASGLWSVPDVAQNMRGMAVKFHLASGAVFDLIAMNVPVSPFRNLDEFLELASAAEPVPVHHQPRWRQILDLLALRQSPPAPPPGQQTSSVDGVFRFATTHPSSMDGVLSMSLASPPASYAQTAFHAIHAFLLTGANGVVRAVRFHWDPVSGGRFLTRADLPVEDNYLNTELTERLALAPVDFILRAQIGESGDDTSDPSKAWPWRRPIISMGTLRLTGLVEDQIADCERISFNPTRLVDGIACSDDPVLRARGPVYQASYERRTAVPCPFASPGQD